MPDVSTKNITVEGIDYDELGLYLSLKYTESQLTEKEPKTIALQESIPEDKNPR